MISRVFVVLAFAFLGQSAVANTVAKRHVLNCADPTNGPVIQQAYNAAKTLSGVARDYIRSNGASDALYVQYFKTNDPNVVANYYNAIANDNTTQTLNCPTSCASGVIAYTDQPSGNIYFCPPFYDEGDTSLLCTSSANPAAIKAGTGIHELSNAINQRGEISQTCDGSAALNVSQQIQNAATYSCFAREVYKNTLC